MSTSGSRDEVGVAHRLFHRRSHTSAVTARLHALHTELHAANSSSSRAW
eukprot:CAMPEP_0170147426 /NCGR_PEP_ID=MMETSP0033_2-20121228/34361_1 /TAXON_ID=195969 /ORGANISM="Dolichomastix tenuilepis, Strain CCMP3274" /LENGTH=48 /DNA_ID= /DNA_START= /DNA_END= /DNA_ORIENTATION=